MPSIAARPQAVDAARGMSELTEDQGAVSEETGRGSRTGEVRLLVDREASALCGALQVDAEVWYTHHRPLAVDQLALKGTGRRLDDHAACNTELAIEPWQADWSI